MECFKILIAILKKKLAIFSSLQSFDFIIFTVNKKETIPKNLLLGDLWRENLREFKNKMNSEKISNSIFIFQTVQLNSN